MPAEAGGISFRTNGRDGAGRHVLEHPAALVQDGGTRLGIAKIDRPAPRLLVGKIAHQQGKAVKIGGLVDAAKGA